MSKYIQKALMLFALSQNPNMARYMGINEIRALFENDKE